MLRPGDTKSSSYISDANPAGKERDSTGKNIDGLSLTEEEK